MKLKGVLCFGCVWVMSLVMSAASLVRTDVFWVYTGEQCVGAGEEPLQPLSTRFLTECAAKCLGRPDCGGYTYNQNTCSFVACGGVTLSPQPGAQCFTKGEANLVQYPEPPTITSVVTTAGPAGGGSGGSYDCVTADPCTDPSRANTDQYFPHADPSKYVQCDTNDACYVKSCTPPLKWYQDQKLCNW